MKLIKRKRLLLLNLIVFIFLFVIIEISFYVYRNYNKSNEHIKDDLFTILSHSEYESDNDLLFKFKPNQYFTSQSDKVTYKIDEKGYRESWTKEEDFGDSQIKIIFLGDSSTFGVEIPFNQTFAEVVKILLQNHSSKKVQVHNFGVPGYTSFQAKKTLQKEISQINPDFVVLFIGANDEAPTLKYSDLEYYNLINNKLSFQQLLSKSNIYLFSVENREKELVRLLSNLNDELPNNQSWYSLALPDILSQLEKEGLLKERDLFRKIRVSKEEFYNNVNEIRRMSVTYDYELIFIPSIWNHNGSIFYSSNHLTRPYLDLKSEIEPFLRDNLFLDEVHPNVKGHETIGKIIYREIIKSERIMS